MATVSPPRPRRAVVRTPPAPHRLDRTALTGVLVREFINYLSFWRGSLVSSAIEPTIYLLAFGLGVGALVSAVDGYSYVDFVGTGTVATAVLFSSALPAMFGSFVKSEFQKTYDALLAAPVDAEEVVTGEAIWIGLRAGVYGNFPLLAAIIFGLDVSWGMLAVPFISFVAGFGWASFGILVSAISKSMDSFSYVTSMVITPMMLFAGSFFPVDDLDLGFRILVNLNPLFHCVQLVRDFVFGTLELGPDLIHFGVILGFALLMWRLAASRMEAKLVD